MIDDPLAVVNIKRGETPRSISGAEFLRRWHTKRNANHPLRVKERQEAIEFMRARMPVVVEVAPREKAYAKKRIKRETPRPDSDGIYQL